MLVIWWDTKIALLSVCSDAEWKERVQYYMQPSSGGGKYGLPLAGADSRMHRSLMTPTNGRDTSPTKHMYGIGKVPTKMVPLNSITLP